ncbi:MAG: hypothetical protein IPL14_16170 [Nitrospira sp.]|nr:hypothetical protein [Nitrospira sp.]
MLDAAKGIEPQTKKLFAVCRKRGIPILTFINKMDQPGRHPFDLLDEIERTLGMTAVPFNWPIGEGSGFQGLYDFQHRQVLFFQRTAQSTARADDGRGLPNPKLAETSAAMPTDPGRKRSGCWMGRHPSIATGSRG